MRIINVSQGSPEWIKAKIGIPSASRFKQIITSGTLKPSGQTNAYLYELLAERAIGEPCSDYSSAFMSRGSFQEGEAKAWYELETESTIETVGFVVRNDGRVGCSPDGLVGNDGLVEIKCPSALKHVGYLLESPIDDYRVQVQGQIYVCEREWNDLLSYNPAMPEAIVRCVRDEVFMKAFEPILERFLDRLDEMWEKLKAKGVTEFVDESEKEFNELFPDK